MIETLMIRWLRPASKNTLNRHIRTAHDLIRYPCDQCEYQATEKGALKKHRWWVHSGVKLQCDQCNYQTAMQRTLDTHIKFVHEGIGYTCDICGHKTSTASNLKLHITRKHNKWSTLILLYVNQKIFNIFLIGRFFTSDHCRLILVTVKIYFSFLLFISW